MFLTYFKIGQCPFVYVTIYIDFLPCSLQCCPVTQSVPHTLIFPQIILCMLVEHSQVDSCQWTSQDTLAHQIKLYVIHLFYCHSLLLYKRSTCEKRKYMVLPVTYICTICSSLLQLERTSAAYSWIGRPKWDHGYSISPLPLVCFQYFKIIWTFQSKPELEMVGLCHLEVNIKLCVEYVLILYFSLSLFELLVRCSGSKNDLAPVSPHPQHNSHLNLDLDHGTTCTVLSFTCMRVYVCFWTHLMSDT